MDIPNSGAIFTLGKSHLAENTQSYFYIRNDPVKRLISGPHQSAVICESGRLFVWGENHYGQLGIGGNSSSSSSSSNNNNNSDHSDTVTKPTCVKSMKTLGLKVADIAFGNDWAVILTHSNELFFSGRNIFADESNATRNFTAATVAQEPCAIIRKPFRLEEFDDCLSASEEPENFVTVLAGNEHFAVMTSFGRLIGWGSNQRHQLGSGNKNDGGAPIQPHEMKLDAPIQQFVCGPESTLVLTENGGLYLTGRLNEFVFPQFTELQKNLAATEQIIFMHISQASEIYIVTNAGSIYRSIESLRNKSLIFQRFYDYDSEENGPIWKLLKGTSFYTVLTKANKFYTTFSESGHHLKTFREISKFKNLRLLDISVGEKHILVHGIPRSSTLSSTVGPGGEHRFMSRSIVMASAGAAAAAGELSGGTNGRSRSGRSVTKENILEEGKGGLDGNGNDKTESMEEERKETPKPNTPIHENSMDKDTETIAQSSKIAEVIELNENTGVSKEMKEIENETATEDDEKINNNNETNVNKSETNGNIEETNDEEPMEQHNNINKEVVNENVGAITTAASTTAVQTLHDSKEDVSSPEPKSPTESTQSRKSVKSVRSIKFDPATVLEKSTSSSDKLLRPRTPYPESSNGSTPQTIKKTPLRNYSYEAAMDHDYIEHTSPVLVESLENIPESTAGETAIAPITAIISTATPPTEEDEQLTVEIIERTSSDALYGTIVVDEIRYINNGVDVTANQQTLETESVNDDEEDEEEEASEGTQSIGDVLEEHTERVNHEAEHLLDQLNEEIDEKVEKAAKSTAEVKTEVANHVKETSETVGERVETKLHEARESMETAAKKAATGARDAVDSVGENAKRVATDARQAVENAADGAKNAMENAGSSAMKAAGDAKNAMENAGSSAMKAAGGAKNAMENALFKMADGTKYAVDTVASKISNEMHGAKENIQSLLHGKDKDKEKDKAMGRNLREDREDEDADDDADVVSIKDDGDAAKTNTATTTTGGGEDDERTTASVNSNHTSSADGGGGNPFESSNNPFENEADHHDDLVERGKRALREDLQAGGRSVAETTEQSKGKVRQFFSDIRAKGRGMSCRNEKSIRIDDEPPRYSVEDELQTTTTTTVAVVNPADQHQNGSKVCVIL